MRVAEVMEEGTNLLEDPKSTCQEIITRLTEMGTSL